MAQQRRKVPVTPAEHYTEAERLLGLAIAGFPASPVADGIVAVAQVHATLATAEPANIGQRKPPIVAAPGDAP